MTQVIIYTNDNGGVSVTVPTGELPIDAVKAKDTPAGSIIVDSSTLPQGSDAQFFDAWELNGRTVSVNLDKAKAFANTMLNSMAKAEVSHRTTNAGIGIENKLSDADWLALLTTARTAISSATTTQQLLDAITPVQSAITANA
jgi:hypothetical protein